jgi:ActR/RegA family two-component response regulator
VCCVLLVDDDLGTIESTSLVLQTEGFEPAAAQSGHEALRLVTDLQPCVALIDLRLPDLSGLDVLAGIRTRSPSTACAILTGFGDLETADRAMQLGAVRFLQKPLLGDELERAVRAMATGPLTKPPEAANVGPSGDIALHAHSRWADVVARAVDAPKDPRTLYEWGRSVGASAGTIRNWCRTARLPARQSLLLARMLRAVIRQHHVHATPEDLLDIVDRRTLAKLLASSGGTHESLPQTVDAFLQAQRFIVDTRATGVLRTVLHARQSSNGGRAD